VIAEHVGGGFGAKGMPRANVILAAMAARITGRPVKCARRAGRWLGGTGVAASTYPARAAASQARASVSAAGRYQVSIAAADIGTGARTALTAVAAEALGVAGEDVELRIGDSALPPAMSPAARWAPPRGAGP
jgi:CO/xanthine dehydrogenase Mo-binding subunit